MVAQGDFLARLPHQGETGWGMMLARTVVAFGLGVALSATGLTVLYAKHLIPDRQTTGNMTCVSL
jgi:hypothetical protein